MDLARESRRWLDEGIIDEAQRGRILALYPERAEQEGSLSLVVLGVLWLGGALVFFGIAFLIGIIYEDLPVVVRLPLLFLIDGFFFAAAAGLRHFAPKLERTSIALFVIGALLMPGAIGITWEELFGSSGHLLPLIAFCVAVYAAMAVWLRSRAFCVLVCAGLFFVGEEVVRDRDFEVLFPLVQLGLVSRLEEVFPIVFLALAGLIGVASVLSGRFERTTHFRGALWVCGVLIALGPAVVGAIPLMTSYDGPMVALSFIASFGAMGASVLLGHKHGFWLGGVAVVATMLILFANVFEDSIAFTCFSIVTGLVTMAIGTYLAVVKRSWVNRLFERADEVSAGLARAEPAAPPGGEGAAGES